MVAIVDYGVGNLFSLESSLRAVGAEVVVTSDKDVLMRADKIILPGVGAFADAAQKLGDTGLDKCVIDLANSGKPLMGICLGMQLLFEKSYEYGEHHGLGLIKGEIRPISDVIPGDYKVPHIGWNALKFKGDGSRLFSDIKEGDCVYFVHSYYATGCNDSVIATCDYGAEITAAVSHKNVYGCQFHPEKSGRVGLAILKTFVNMEEGRRC